MKCIHCDSEAQAVCKFCGRAVCKQHIQEQQYVTGYTTKRAPWNIWGNVFRAISVLDAVWCGVCHPKQK